MSVSACLQLLWMLHFPEKLFGILFLAASRRLATLLDLDRHNPGLTNIADVNIPGKYNKSSYKKNYKNIS